MKTFFGLAIVVILAVLLGGSITYAFGIWYAPHLVDLNNPETIARL